MDSKPENDDKPRKKATKEEVRKRIDAILTIMLDGAVFSDLLQFSADSGWGVGPRQVRNYQRRAFELIKADATKGRKRKLLLHIARREKLFARCVAAADFRSALAVLRDLAALEGLYPNPAEELRRDVAELKQMLEDSEAKRYGDANPAPIAEAGKAPPLKFDGKPVCSH